MYIESHSQLFLLIHNSRQIEIIYSKPEYQEKIQVDNLRHLLPPLVILPLTNVVFGNDEEYCNAVAGFDGIEPDYDVTDKELNMNNALETIDLNIVVTTEQAEDELQRSVGKEVEEEEEQEDDE
ncbi:hypothetical protein JTB14_022702 [Gonioctena quinquepunctata]|nr:hypothetical protein JTB14_022702 [Gonioctena quinquepunctata]